MGKLPNDWMTEGDKALTAAGNLKKPLIPQSSDGWRPCGSIFPKKWCPSP